jgi:hypothetical protein
MTLDESAQIARLAARWQAIVRRKKVTQPEKSYLSRNAMGIATKQQ